MQLDIQEIWRPIKGYEGLYEISNKGRVRSFFNGKWGISNEPHFIVGQMGKHYRNVVLSKDNRNKSFYIHRLVAETFISNPLGFNEVNHIDGNKLNNSVNNLEWCTHKENMIHASSVGLFKTRQKIVVCKETGEEFNSITSAAKSVDGIQGSLSYRILYRDGRYKGKTFYLKEA